MSFHRLDSVSFLNEVDRMFNDLFRYETVTHQPNVDKDEWGIRVKIDVPGYGRNDLDIELEGDILKISSDAFDKRYRIGSKLDKHRLTASVSKGVLEIKVPYKNSEKPRKIKIK